MEITHDTINSISLAVMALVIYLQREQVKGLKSMLEIIDISKIKALTELADDIRNRDREVSLKEHEIKTMEVIRDGISNYDNNLFEDYKEILLWTTETLSEMSEQEMMETVSQLPRNKEHLLRTQISYRAGHLEGAYLASKQHNQDQ